MNQQYPSQFLKAVSLALMAMMPSMADAGIIQGAPTTVELSKYLMIGTGSSTNGDAVNIQNTEIGADRAFLSDGSAAPNSQSQAGPNLRDVFYQNGDRWTSDTDTPVGAADVFVGIDWSGNVAITAEDGKFSMSDVDVYADIGIDCAAASIDACKQSVSNTTYFADGVGPGSGVSIDDDGINTGTDFTDLLNEMLAWEAFIEGLTADATITANIVDENRKDGTGSLFTSFVDLDGNGISVIDIDVGNIDFELNNSDWILDGAEDQFYIFRILNGSNFNLSNSSILLGDGGIGGGSSTSPISELGAIFYHASETQGSSDSVFNFNNAILNGIGFWDFNDSDLTRISVNDISLNNGQGCAQFISSHIDMNDIRFNRCALSVQVPEPSPLLLLGAGLLGLAFARRKRVRLA